MEVFASVNECMYVCVGVCVCMCEQKLDRLDALMSTMIKARRAAPHKMPSDLLGQRRS